jgi:hypothetical protein
MDQGTTVLIQLYLFTRELAAERYLRDHAAYLARHYPDGAARHVAEGWIGICRLRRKAVDQAEASLRLAYGWIAPRIDNVTPEVRTEFRRFEDGVIQFYEEARDKNRAATWKVRRMDLDFPADPLRPDDAGGRG